MKKFTLLTILLIFLTTSQAQVQFVSVGNNLSGTSRLKVASFKSDGTSALLHEFKIVDPTDCNGAITGPGGKLYGTTFSGGGYYNGTLFSVNPDGTNFKVIYNYKKQGTPIPPTPGPDGKLYLVISDSLYTISAEGSALTFINKVAPGCKRIVISDDEWVYGCGDENNSQFMFRVKTDGSGYVILHVFDKSTEGFLNVRNSLVCITPTGRIFFTCSGAANNKGILASMRANGSDFTINKTFTSADEKNYGSQPFQGGAVLHNNGKIIFTMSLGGQYSSGSILSFDTLTSTLTHIFSFPSILGRYATRNHPQLINGKLVGLISTGLYSVGLDGTGYQQLNVLPVSGYSILNYDTSTNSLFYSTEGGVFKNTRLVKIDAISNITGTIHSFGNVPEGYNPEGVIRIPNGVLYGIGRNGGSEGGGTLFKMNADGPAFSVVKDFASNNGQSPFGKLLYASDGRLYGVCNRSGPSGSSDSMLIYGIDIDGNNYAVLHVFEKTGGDVIPELAESSSGEIAGLINSNQFQSPFKIFKLKKDGTGFTILKTLSPTGTNGYASNHGLVLYNGYFYGANTTFVNGSQVQGSIFRINEEGSDFSVIKYFNAYGPDGSAPEGGLTLGLNNKLYGVTLFGGSNHSGTAFALNPSDLTFRVIYNFDRLSDGSLSTGKFTTASDGKIYTPRTGGIFGIDHDGSNPVFISSADYNPQQNESSFTYLTEIPLPETTELCPPTESTLLASDIKGIDYQWQLNTGTGFVSITDNSYYIGTNTDSLILTNIPSSWNGYQFRCLAAGGASKTYTLKFVNSWTGAINSSWENPANWSCGSIPDTNTDVVIDSGTVVVKSNVSIRSLKVAPGVNFTVNPRFVLSITH